MVFTLWNLAVFLDSWLFSLGCAEAKAIDATDRCNWLLYLSWLKDEIIPLIKYLDILGSQAQSVGMLPDPLGIDLFIHAKLNCCNHERRALHVRVY